MEFSVCRGVFAMITVSCEMLSSQHNSTPAVYRFVDRRSIGKWWRVKTDFNSRKATLRRICRIACLALTLYCCLPIYAYDPNPGVGMKVGLPYEILNVNNYYRDNSVQRDIKPSFSGSFEVSLPWSFSLEVSASYKRMKYHRTVEDTPPICPGCSLTKTTYDTDIQGHAWEFPLIFRHNLAMHRSVGVFAEGGFVARRSYTTTNETRNGSFYFFPVQKKYLRKGFVAGLGVDITVAPLHIVPSVRYSGLLEPETYPLSEGGEIKHWHSIEILLGFRFGGQSAHPR